MGGEILETMLVGNEGRRKNGGNCPQVRRGEKSPEPTKNPEKKSLLKETIV